MALKASHKVSFETFGKGQPIILLHGWGASKEKLIPLGRSLAKKNWQVLALDLPGFGKSGFPSAPWQVGDYAEFVIKVKNRIFGKRKVYFFGHSFGGRITIKIASVFPNQSKGIILCGSAGLSRGSSLKRIFFLSIAKIGKLFLSNNQFFRRLVYKLAREHDYQKTSGLMRDTFKKVIEENLRPLLSQIKIPALILWGRKDKMTKYQDAIILDREINNSQLTTFEGAGHQLPYQKPELVAKQITEWRKTCLEN